MKKLQLQATDGGVRLSVGKKSVGDIFKAPISVKCIDTRYAAAELATVCVSEELYKELCGEKAALIEPVSGKFINVIPKPSAALKGEHIRITNHIHEQLSAEAESELLLCPYSDQAYTKFFPQRIDHIRENNLVISPSDARGLERDLTHSACDLFEVYNLTTRESLIVKRSHIYVDTELPAGSIRLNRRQRISLGLELPLYLDETRRARVDTACTEEERAAIKGLYREDSGFLNEDAPYEEKENAKKIFLRIMHYELRIIPVIEAYYRPERRGPLRFLSDLYVGKSTASLICRRPYENDEGINVVRMSKSNMHLLGVEEMDMVRIKYKKREVRCRVLELDNEKFFFKTNPPVPTELVIGIPSHLRKKLGITGLNTAVKVDRDTGFIFKRSINEQIVPVLLTFFSTGLLGTVSEYISLAVSISVSVALIPIVVFFNLSSKRNMRG